jgi:hypothetical protein
LGFICFLLSDNGFHQRIVADRISFVRRFGRESAAAAAGLSVEQITKRATTTWNRELLFQMIASALEN